jgi:hypothetical protein
VPTPAGGKPAALRPTPQLAASDSTRPPRAWVGNAFGLRLEADLPVLGLDQRQVCTEPPQTLLRQAAPESIDAAWSPSAAERLLDHRYPDGRVMMTVDAHPEHGYRIDAPGHGRFRVAADGSLVECAPAPGPAWRWHRPLCAQALPLAAALNGMEILHASAVVVDGNAIAFFGHSGEGKTSLAIHLVDQGAALMADDVVALSAASAKLRAHPGVRFANVAEEQLESVAPDRRERLGRVIGRSEKLHILIDPMADAAAPLGAFYILHRRRSVRELEFERLWPPDPRLLFGATFNSHVTTRVRMTAQLEVCSLIAERVATFRLRIPPSLGAAELAPAVAVHARQSCSPGSDC